MINLSPWLGDVPEATMDRLRDARRILAIGHESPDADAIGASLAVAVIAETLGGRATVAFSDPIPELYGFLPGVGRIVAEPDPSWPYDLLVISDCSGLDRIGGLAERHGERLAALPTLVLDHHASTLGAGPLDWVDPGAAATCEMIALLALRLGVPLTAGDGTLAAALMAGVVMDTATFAHPNATPRTLAVAAALVEAGAPLSETSRRLYRTKPTRQLELFGRVLGRMESTAGGRVVLSTLLEADLEATGTSSAHSEGIIDLLAQAEEADVALLFKETGSATRVSVRTRPGGVDATTLTATFGGGGHARAAGATLDVPVPEARERVLAVAERLVHALRA